MFHTARNWFVSLTLSVFPLLRDMESIRVWQVAVISVFACMAAFDLASKAD
jgi:hypothetical protein